MIDQYPYLLAAVASGLGATAFMDAWALFLKFAFGVAPANYCLVGRWLSYMPRGKFVHANIAATPPMRAECVVGWIAHYLIGAAYAFMFVAIVSGAWLQRPSILPAVTFGIVSVLVPYLVMQPAFGLGIAASKTPKPMQARLKSLMAHAIFGVGLYLGALCVSSMLQIAR